MLTFDWGFSRFLLRMLLDRKCTLYSVRALTFAEGVRTESGTAAHDGSHQDADRELPHRVPSVHSAVARADLRWIRIGTLASPVITTVASTTRVKFQLNFGQIWSAWNSVKFKLNLRWISISYVRLYGYKLYIIDGVQRCIWDVIIKCDR